MSQFKTDSMEGLQQLYIEELRDLYSAEKPRTRSCRP